MCAGVAHAHLLNIAIDGQALLLACQAKLAAAGSGVLDCTDFLQASVHDDGVVLDLQDRRDSRRHQLRGRLVRDAMGTASSVAWQLHGGQPFDSVCATLGMVVEGIPPEIWDPNLGNGLFSHGDVSRQRQLIWELFPARATSSPFSSSTITGSPKPIPAPCWSSTQTFSKFLANTSQSQA